MNAAVTIVSATNWDKFTLEEWLYQFGAWMNSVSGTCGKSINPIAIAMDEAVIKQKFKKLNEEQKQEIIANHFLSDVKPQLTRTTTICQITDNEARAVQRLILDMQGKSEVMDGWMNAIISRYFYGNSWSEMVIWGFVCDKDGNKVYVNNEPKMTKHYSENDARADVKCGLAALHSRYSFIKYK